ncbi:MAG: MBL fold metallo-hydrolase [Candidatus Omnitrophica bacterium]|nr:MBL fold metallo-hydrolase [Candidatus Omnitrophota bacterium]
MIKQLRASGGIWIEINDSRILVDPGPGSLVKANKSRPRLNISSLDAIFVSHKHIDHSNDVNVMIEAMTDGGFRKKGTLFCPVEAINNPAVVFPYALELVENVHILKSGTQHNVKKLKITVPVRLHHQVETYGFILESDNVPSIGYIPDTCYFPEIIDAYAGTKIVIINVVFTQPRPDIMHLSLPEALEIISGIKPGKAILTHFGMSMLKERIWEKTQNLSKKLSIDIIAASDGMTLNL